MGSQASPPGEEGREQRNGSLYNLSLVTRNQGKGGELSRSPRVRDRRREADSVRSLQLRKRGTGLKVSPACSSFLGLLSASSQTLGPKPQVTNKRPPLPNHPSGLLHHQTQTQSHPRPHTQGQSHSRAILGMWACDKQCRPTGLVSSPRVVPPGPPPPFSPIHIPAPSFNRAEAPPDMP